MGDHDRRSQTSPRGGAHSAARASFAEYATVQALGQATAVRFLIVTAHLERCPTCRAEFESLLEVVMAAYSGQIAPAAHILRCDLSFLHTHQVRPAEAHQTRIIDDLRQLAISFSEALFASRQPLALAQAARGEMLYHFTPNPASENVNITIDVFAGDDDPQLGKVQVLVDIAGRDPFEQSGIRVTLQASELAWRGTTSETGSVTFAAIPLNLLPHLRVEISLPSEL
jgi:anti-sigma factor RsiW